jgi:hypothetical protein
MKLIFVALLLIPAMAFAQSTIKISGKVLDSGTKEPMPFATVSIKNKPVGTLTNDEGSFDFYFSDEYSNDTLVVSSLGYSRYFSPVRSIGDKTNIQIALVAKPVILDDVIVNSKKSDPNLILKKAFDNVEKNYSLEPYVYRAFFRELWAQNDQAVSLVESVFDIHDDGYKPNRKNTVKVREKVDLNSVRGSKNYMNAVFKPFMESYNALTSALQYNQVKYPAIVGNLTEKEITLDDIVFENDNAVFVVRVISHYAPNKNYERSDKFYIESGTFAVTKIESKEYAKDGTFRAIPWKFPKADSIYLYRPKDVTSVYEFEPYQGNYYLKYYYEKGAAEIYNTKTKTVDYELKGTSLFVVTEVITGPKQKKIANSMDHGKSLILQVSPYNESFWNDNNEVKLVPLTTKEMSELEREMPLAKQFMQPRVSPTRQ